MRPLVTRELDRDDECPSSVTVTKPIKRASSRWPAGPNNVGTGAPLRSRVSGLTVATLYYFRVQVLLMTSEGDCGQDVSDEGTRARTPRFNPKV
jgi:hypothetical protein